MEISLDLSHVKEEIDLWTKQYFFEKTLALSYNQGSVIVPSVRDVNLQLSYYYSCKTQIIIWQDRLEKEGRILLEE